MLIGVAAIVTALVFSALTAAAVDTIYQAIVEGRQRPSLRLAAVACAAVVAALSYGPSAG